MPKHLRSEHENCFKCFSELYLIGNQVKSFCNIIMYTDFLMYVCGCVCCMCIDLMDLETSSVEMFLTVQLHLNRSSYLHNNFVCLLLMFFYNS